MLTICIPTYNRRTELEVAIESLGKVFGHSAHLVVSDNCSNDGTVEYLASYATRSNFASFRYVVNERNVGVDSNFLNVVSLSATEYVVLFGSDDVPMENSANLIMEAINDEVDIAIFGRRLTTRSMNRVVGDEIFWSKPTREKWRLDCETAYAKYFDSCTSIAGAFSFISSILFRKSLWKIDDKVCTFIGSYYVHVAALLRGMLSKKAVYLLVDPRPLVKCRLGNDSFDGNGAYRRVEMDWNAFERIASEFFAGPAQSSLKHILSYQCSTYALLALRYHIESEGRLEQIKVVSRRLLEAEWGRYGYWRWKLVNLIPIKLIDTGVMIRNRSKMGVRD